jgi:16S rRNA processing protein RimM
MALKLEGINSRNEAEGLRDCFLTVSEDMTPPLPEGEYYHFQIIDMSVYTRKLEYLGQITQILPTGSNDVYVVSDEDEELLIPAVDEVIVEVDVAQGTMTVDLPDGLRPGH